MRFNIKSKSRFIFQQSVWPSGLRRCVQVAVCKRAWVRIPQLTLIFKLFKIGWYLISENAGIINFFNLLLWIKWRPWRNISVLLVKNRPLCPLLANQATKKEEISSQNLRKALKPKHKKRSFKTLRRPWAKNNGKLTSKYNKRINLSLRRTLHGSLSRN